VPSKSPSQARLMAAAAHDAKFAKKTGVPQSVAQEFNKADKGSGKKPFGKFSFGSKTKTGRLRIGNKSY
jgi:hypothetical protein